MKNHRVCDRPKVLFAYLVWGQRYCRRAGSVMWDHGSPTKVKGKSILHKKGNHLR